MLMVVSFFPDRRQCLLEELKDKYGKTCRDYFIPDTKFARIFNCETEKNDDDLLLRLLKRDVYKGKSFFSVNLFTYIKCEFLRNTKALVEIAEKFPEDQIFQLLKPANPLNATLLHRIICFTCEKEKFLTVTRLLERLTKGEQIIHFFFFQRMNSFNHIRLFVLL